MNKGLSKNFRIQFTFRFFETCTAMVNNEKKEKEAFNTNVVTSFRLEMNLSL